MNRSRVWVEDAAARMERSLVERSAKVWGLSDPRLAWISLRLHVQERPAVLIHTRISVRRTSICKPI
jgi:hypothetical protein